MVNYSKAKIYKIEPICEHEAGDVYIGSTTKEYLSQRMVNHRKDYRGWLRGACRCVTVFKLFEKYGIENCRIELLECVNASCKDELIAREAFYIRAMNCVNKVIPDRTKEEWGREYYKNNKEEISESQKKYYENNRAAILERTQKYRENNKEKINEYQQKYRENNKEKRNEKRRLRRRLKKEEANENLSL